MKKRLLASAFGVAALVLMSSCTTAIQKRVETNPKIFESLTETQKAKVQQGQIEIGMPKEAVFLAWGRPNRASRQQELKTQNERWSYTSYEGVVRNSRPYGYGFGFGYYDSPYHYGYYGHYDPLWYEPMVEYIPYESRRVDFVNGRVTGFRIGPPDQDS